MLLITGVTMRLSVPDPLYKYVRMLMLAYHLAVRDCVEGEFFDDVEKLYRRYGSVKHRDGVSHPSTPHDAEDSCHAT